MILFLLRMKILFLLRMKILFLLRMKVLLLLRMKVLLLLRMKVLFFKNEGFILSGMMILILSRIFTNQLRREEKSDTIYNERLQNATGIKVSRCF